MRARERRAENPLKAKEDRRRWSEINREHERQYAAERRWSRGVKKKGSVYLCVDCGRPFELVHGIQVHCGPCRDRNSEELNRLRAAEWNRKNKEQRNTRSRERFRANAIMRLNVSMRTGIYYSLRGNKNRISWRTMVPYTLDELKTHIERQFTKGMGWENYGEWHVDHIVPLSSFTFEKWTDPEFGAAWSLTNLRPLWGKENVRKNGNRYHLL